MATLDDAGILAAIEQRSARAPWSERALAESLPLPGYRAWVAERPSQPVGHLRATAVAGEGEILTVAVLPEARRGGVATALLDAAARWWREEGVVEAFLEARTDNEGALALYEARGWKRIAVRRRYYGDGTDAVVMRFEP